MLKSTRIGNLIWFCLVCPPPNIRTEPACYPRSAKSPVDVAHLVRFLHRRPGRSLKTERDPRRHHSFKKVAVFVRPISVQNNPFRDDSPLQETARQGCCNLPQIIGYGLKPILAFRIPSSQSTDPFALLWNTPLKHLETLLCHCFSLFSSHPGGPFSIRPKGWIGQNGMCPKIWHPPKVVIFTHMIVQISPSRYNYP